MGAESFLREEIHPHRFFHPEEEGVLGSDLDVKVGPTLQQSVRVSGGVETRRARNKIRPHGFSWSRGKDMSPG